MPNPAIKIWKLEDGATAVVRIHPPTPVSVDELREALAAEGVVEGVLEDALAAVAAAPPDEEVLIAQGVAAVGGEHARVQYAFETANVPFKLLETAMSGFKPDGTPSMQLVAEGTVLATKTPATPGTPGRSVTGAAIAPIPGKDAFLVPGPYTIAAPGNHAIIAALPGQPYQDRERVGIVPILALDEVEGGRSIDFKGTVLINGTVAEGAVVKAGGDVEVRGTIEGGVVEAGGRVRIWGGVRGAAKVTAGGEINAKFVESESELTAEGPIAIMENALASRLVAKGKITVGQSVIGGLTRSAEAITTLQAGTLSETPTRLEIRPESSEENLARLRSEVEAQDGELAELNRMIQNILSKPEQGAGALQPMTARKLQITAALNKLRSEIARLERQQDTFKAEVTILGKAHPGVSVLMDRDSHTFSELKKDLVITLEHQRMRVKTRQEMTPS